MEGWLFFLGFIFVCGIIWGIVKGQEDKERAQERGLTFDERINNMTDFTPTQKVNGVMNMYVFAVDKNHRKVAYLEEQQETYIPFEDIISIEIVEDNTTLASKSTMRTVGGAIVGGALAGGAGAIVGGLSGDSKMNNIQNRSEKREDLQL